MASAYPARSTYSSPALAGSPRAAPTTAPATAPAASKGRFWRKQPAAPLTAGAAAAAATSSTTNGTSNSNSVPATVQQPSATGFMESAAAPTAHNGNTGAFTQYHGQTRANEYPREAELGPVGPHGINGGASQGNRTAPMHGQRQDGNRAGFFQSSQA